MAKQTKDTAKVVKSAKVEVPGDVPKQAAAEYTKNYLAVTHGKGRMMLFAGDQKVEHMNDDHIDVEHLFKIAAAAKISCFASELGTIARYGKTYPNVPYLIKMNSKTNAVPNSQHDPVSLAWFSVDDVVAFKKSSGLNVVGIGYTVYLGSEYENKMLREVANLIFQAHRHGLIAVVWMYPQGKAIKDEVDPHTIAGGTSVACCLGADFVKVKFPKLRDPAKATPEARAEAFKEAVAAAGPRTKVICSGGEKMEPQAFLQQLWDQIHLSGASGNATGRNIHERPFAEAVRFANAVYALTIDNATVAEAVKILSGK